jgi:nitrogen regulatory protein P-II 1
MDMQMIVAIIRNDRLEAVEARLRHVGVEGISVSKVKGYGEYRNFFASDWMSEEARLEIFASSGQADAVVEAITQAGCTGAPGDGIVAVVPVRALYRIRTREAA